MTPLDKDEQEQFDRLKAEFPWAKPDILQNIAVKAVERMKRVAGFCPHCGRYMEDKR